MALIVLEFASGKSEEFVSDDNAPNYRGQKNSSRVLNRMPSKKNPRQQSDPKASRPYMPGYGVLGPKSGRGLLPWKWARKKFSEARNYWVGTTRPNGSPHMMPIWGVMMDDVFYFSTEQNSQKARNLQSNPKCVVSIGRQDNEEAIIVEGVAEKVTEKTLLTRFKEAYQAKYKWDMSAFNEPLYAGRPTTAFAFSAYGDFVGTATRWKFSEV